MYNFGYLIGLIVGLGFALLILVFIIRYCRGSWKNLKAKYDERQKLAMGKAYRDGFWVLLAAVACANALAKAPAFAEYSEIFFTTACFLGIGVYVIECILRDAYMGLNDNAKKWTIVLIIMCLLNLLCTVQIIRWEGLLAAWLNLMCVLLIVSVTVVYWIRGIVQKREVEDIEDMEK